MPPGGGDRGLLLDVVGVAGLADAAVGPILVPLHPPDKPFPLQGGDGLPRRRRRTVAVCRDGFHRRPALFLLSCAAHQKAVHRELDRRQVVAEQRVAEKLYSQEDKSVVE